MDAKRQDDGKVVEAISVEEAARGSGHCSARWRTDYHDFSL